MTMLPSQAARILGVSVSTLIYWERKGKIRARRTAGRWRMYLAEDVEKLRRDLKAQI